VSKNVLGRGLGELLPERAGPDSRDSTPLHKSKDPTDLGPGLRALVLNKNGGAPQLGRITDVQRESGTVVKVSLVLADVLLVAITLLWRRQAQGRMGGLEGLICIASITFAAWLGCLTAWLHYRPD
jgi:hypothetical protein